jgi:hypothetical protein
LIAENELKIAEECAANNDVFLTPFSLFLHSKQNEAEATNITNIHWGAAATSDHSLPSVIALI